MLVDEENEVTKLNRQLLKTIEQHKKYKEKACKEILELCQEKLKLQKEVSRLNNLAGN